MKTKWTVMGAVSYTISKNPELGKNKYKNQLWLKVQGLTGMPVKLTSVDRCQRTLVPRGQR